MREDFKKLQDHFEASKSRMGEEVSYLRGLMEVADGRAFDAEVAQQTLLVDLATKQSECNQKDRVIEQLQTSNKELTSLS